MQRIEKYIYQQDDWPNFKWDFEKLTPLLAQVRHLQGKLIGKMESLGFDLRSEANLETLTLEALKSNEIEGEILNSEQIRSSLARRLGMNISGLVASDRNVDGVVDMMLDATLHYQQSLSEDRLFGWQSALFPTGRSGMSKIIVGSFRDDTNGPMLVVSGTIGRERVHFEAPAAIQLKKEIAAFIRWFNNENDLDSVLKAGLAHFWFVIIHPFDDGNGRIARTITDMLLARSDGVSQRFYSMSAQIRKERKQYYDVLEKSQKGSLNITDWLEWFLNCLYNTLNASEKILERVLIKHQFWNKNAAAILNSRQVLMLNKLLDGFTDKMTSSKWAKITKCSADTALRDIQDLIKKQVLKKDLAGGRSTNYELK